MTLPVGSREFGAKMLQYEVLGALGVAVYTTDAEGRINFYNEAAAELWGQRPELGTDQWCGSWRLYWPDGSPMAHAECPMAVTLKEGRPIRGAEAILERPDGTRVRFCPYPSPLRNEAGDLTGAINVLVDVTDRHKADFELARLAAIVDTSDDAIVSKTLEGTVTSWNAGATRIFGYTPAEMVGRPITRIIPPDLHPEEERILQQLRRGKRIEHYETERITKDGRRIDISLSISPLYDRTGAVVGASKIARDISERKRAEGMQLLLIEELNHRVKNTLAMVQAIGGQSLRRSKSPADFVASFTGRMQSLARAHTLLTENEWRGTDIESIVREQVMLDAADSGRISMSGPLLHLDPQLAVHLALVLHELGTNARKYGALSVLGGKLAISWEVRMQRGRELVLTWREHNGPKVSVPTQHGFGSALIEQTVRSHGGEASIRYDVDGVTCLMRMPIPPENRSTQDLALTARRTATETTMAGLEPKQSALAGRRILVVEDEPLVSMDIEASLEEAGCQIVGPAGTVEAARQQIAAGECDAALLDANLDGNPVDGLAVELTKRNIPFAFITGYDRSALPQGFRDVLMLAKPFNDNQLRTLVETLLYQGTQVVPLRRKDPPRSA
jgi:PAS domain S-box-containing protein